MAGIVVLIGSILFSLLVFGGLIILQIFLSKSGSKVAGLILPILSFVMAIVISLAIPAFSMFNQASTVTYSDSDSFYIEDEMIVEEFVEDESSGSTGIVGVAFSFIIVFIITNIPTAVYLAIYFGCRPKKQKIQLDKMSIQDLN